MKTGNNLQVRKIKIPIILVFIFIASSLSGATSLRNFTIEKNIPSEFVAGETQDMIFSFDNIATESKTTISELNITSLDNESSINRGEFQVNGILNTSNDLQEGSEEYILKCEEKLNGTFRCFNQSGENRIVLPKSENILKIYITSNKSLESNDLNFSIDLYTREKETFSSTIENYYGSDRTVVCQKSDWECGNWTKCMEGFQTKECERKFDCNDLDNVKPLENRSCEEEKCPTCPDPLEWSGCKNGTMERINYRCDSDTNFECEEYTEEIECEFNEAKNNSEEIPGAQTGFFAGNQGNLLAGVIFLILIFIIILVWITKE